MMTWWLQVVDVTDTHLYKYTVCLIASSRFRYHGYGLESRWYRWGDLK